MMQLQALRLDEVFAVLRSDLLVDTVPVNPALYEQLDETCDGFKGNTLVALHEFTEARGRGRSVPPETRWSCCCRSAFGSGCEETRTSRPWSCPQPGSTWSFRKACGIRRRPASVRCGGARGRCLAAQPDAASALRNPTAASVRRGGGTMSEQAELDKLLKDWLEHFARKTRTPAQRVTRNREGFSLPMVTRPTDGQRSNRSCGAGSMVVRGTRRSSPWR